VTFGANLANAPNSTFTCGSPIPPTGFLPGSTSCLYFSGAPGPSPYAPILGTGTVTAVHVRVGPVTGPMQVVIMRSLYQNKAGDPGHPYFACCFVERYGPLFTPQANTVTTVQTNLPMTEEPTPASEDFTTNAAGDFLALSVLDPNVPVPIFVDNQSGDSGSYPAPTEQTFPAPSPVPLSPPNFTGTTLLGGQVMVSADIEGGGAAPGGGGGGGPGGGIKPGGGGGGVTPVPVLGLPQLTIPVNGNTATVPIQCLVVDCTGILTLQNLQQAGLARAARKKAKAKKPKVVSYGSASFSLKAGTTGKVKVTLNGAGRKLFKRGKKTAKVWANARFTSGGGAPKSVRITLKR
jgi:hypothetical protein